MRVPALLLLAPVVCVAQAAPHISFEATHFDFGKISADTKVSHRFKVTNTGQGPLNITRLNPSCGCTSTVIGKWTLAPQESTEIEVSFNPAGFRGVSRKSIQVISNDPASPTSTLTFEADVVREIMPSTDSVFFQDLVRSVPRKASVKFSSGTERPVQLTDAKAPGAPYLATAMRRDGHDAWVDITLDGRKIPAGRQMGADAIIVHTANPKVPFITVTVQWEMRASVVAEPLRVAWSETTGQELHSRVVLKQVDGKAFRILSYKTTNPLISVDGVTKAAAARHQFDVVLAPEAKAGLYTEKVLLTLDDPNQPELELRVSASLR
ncbi:MAG: DUF1573 domain-containing protein [Holophaga sp.]|nr:DUF1573 domain-containing protein [Holophaga sp.]